VDALIQAALKRGGRDNITVIVIDARNVLNDADVATTAPRTAADAEEEDTLPRAGSEDAADGRS
jgi:protein phosphatase